jgi:predicted GNAT superfamily acetyltransferase
VAAVSLSPKSIPTTSWGATVCSTVCATGAQSHRIGSLLYEDLFRFARQTSVPVITCEYNIKPPNEASRMFHDKFGFREQGKQWLAGASEQVSLQAAET